MPEHQPDAPAAHFGMNKTGHLRIQRIEQLRRTLNDGHIDAQFPQVFRQLQADESAARQNRGARLLPLYKRADTQRIFHGAQREHPLRFHAGQLRLRGLRPW